jgi:hypothetical protein
MTGGVHHVAVDGVLYRERTGRAVPSKSGTNPRTRSNGTGHESYEWTRVVIKELVDNAIDAAEEAEMPPVIKVTITTGKSGRPTRIVVKDNGPGIPPATISAVIDYNIRVSSREAYISPTRGRQGNALKTILPMSYATSSFSSFLLIRPDTIRRGFRPRSAARRDSAS